MREIQIRKEETGQRLDKFLRRFLPGAAPGFLYKMLRKKNILMDGRRASGHELLQEGSRIQIYFSEETIQRFQSVSKPSSPHRAPVLSDKDVVFLNSSMLLINKPAGILTQKAEKNDISLTEMARSWLLEKGYRTEEDDLFYEPGPANRLDRNTSGLVVIPLSLASAQQLSEMFRNRVIHKRYLTLTAGSYSGPARRTAWCTRDSVSRRTEIFLSERKGADRIETICEPLAIQDGRSLLRVTLVTGKTHQIRSHLQACGYPVIGDPKYGDFLPEHARRKKGCFPDTAARTPLKRQFLHAWQLEFPTCEGVLSDLSCRVFTAPLPEDLKKELAACGFDISGRISVI